jgi:hypothetical protein
LLPFDYNKLKVREIDLESHVSKTRAGEAASSLAGWTLPGQPPTPG